MAQVIVIFKIHIFMLCFFLLNVTLFVFRITNCQKFAKEHVPVDADSLDLTASSKFMAAVDINRNSKHVPVDAKRNDEVCDSRIASDCYQPPVQHSVATTVALMSAHSCSSGTLRHISGGGDCDESRPILRPPKKRRINLMSDESADELHHSNKFTDVIPPLSRADLTEWKGQRVLARSLTDSVYRPGVIRSISTSDSSIGIQFDSQDEVVQTSADSVICDSAPPSAGIFVGMGVCVRTSSECVEYRLGVVRDRFLQPPFNKFLVELKVCDRHNEPNTVWVSRASLRLLQVFLPLCCHDGTESDVK